MDGEDLMALRDLGCGNQQAAIKGYTARIKDGEDVRQIKGIDQDLIYIVLCKSRWL